MLQEITKTIFLVLFLYSANLFCMDQEILYSRAIQVFKNGDEIIYVIGETISESLSDAFQSFGKLIQAGKFVKAKKRLKNYCNQLIDTLKLQNNRKHYSVDELRELTQIFELKSKHFLKSLDSNLNIIKIGCNETVRLLGLLASICTVLVGIVAFDSGMLLIGIGMALILCCYPMAFSPMGSLGAITAIIYEPGLFFNLVVLVSVTCVMSLLKINNKKIEKNRQVVEIKKLILDFKKMVNEQIGLRPDNFEMKADCKSKEI